MTNPFFGEAPRVMEETPSQPPWPVEPGGGEGDGGVGGASDGAPRVADRRVWREILAVLCIAVIPSLWTSIHWLIRPTEPASFALQSATQIVLGACSIYPLLFIARQSGVPLQSIGIARPKGSDALMGVALLVLVWGAHGVMSNWFHGETSVDARLFAPTPPTLLGVALLCVATLVSVFSEELVFRGYLISRLESATASTPKSIAIAALLFGIGHICQGLLAVSFITVGFGVLLGLCFVVTRRVWPGVVCHFAWNLLVTWPTSDA